MLLTGLSAGVHGVRIVGLDQGGLNSNGLNAIIIRTDSADIARMPWMVDQQFPYNAVDGSGIHSCTEAGFLVTVTTNGNHNFSNGQSIAITSVVPAGYNGTFTISNVTPTTFQYTNGVSGLGASTLDLGQASRSNIWDLQVASTYAFRTDNDITPITGVNLVTVAPTTFVDSLIIPNTDNGSFTSASPGWHIAPFDGGANNMVVKARIVATAGVNPRTANLTWTIANANTRSKQFRCNITFN